METNPQGFSFEKITYYRFPTEKVFYHHTKNEEHRLKLVYIQRAHVMDFEILRGYARKLPWSFTLLKFWEWNAKDEEKCQKVRDEIDKLCLQHNITVG